MKFQPLNLSKVILCFIMAGFLCCPMVSAYIGQKEPSQPMTEVLKAIAGNMIKVTGATFHRGPENPVTLSTFWISKYELTEGEYNAIMGKKPSKNNPSIAKGSLSRNACEKFIEQLNTLAGKKIYRLPTEAEWEFVCEAGSNLVYKPPNVPKKFKLPEGDPDHPVTVVPLEDYAWFADNDRKPGCQQTPYGGVYCPPNPVGKLKPNPWGFYDMLGNVAEWVSDRYGDYPKGPVKDPQGPPKGRHGIVRGGSTRHYGFICNCGSRDPSYHTGWSLDDNEAVGMRLASSVDPMSTTP